MVLEETAVSHRGGSIKIEKTPTAFPLFLKIHFHFYSQLFDNLCALGMLKVDNCN